MDSAEMRRTLREVAGLRVGPHTAEYVAGQLTATHAAEAGCFVMGGDARTGRPVRRQVTLKMLARESADP
jgi:hypothetical protein